MITIINSPAIISILEFLFIILIVKINLNFFFLIIFFRYKFVCVCFIIWTNKKTLTNHIKMFEKKNYNIKTKHNYFNKFGKCPKRINFKFKCDCGHMVGIYT